mgnify:CR=1 FL=1
MTLNEIKEAVRSGKTVCEGTPAYEVRLHTFKDGAEQWLIKCIHNNYCIGLTWADGVTLNGSNFFIKDEPQLTEDIYACADCGREFTDANERDDHFMSEACPNRGAYDAKPNQNKE